VYEIRLLCVQFSSLPPSWIFYIYILETVTRVEPGQSTVEKCTRDLFSFVYVVLLFIIIEQEYRLYAKYNETAIAILIYRHKRPLIKHSDPSMRSSAPPPAVHCASIIVCAQHGYMFCGYEL